MARGVHARPAKGGLAAASVGVLRQLPPDLATFTGRADSLRRLLDAVERETAARADQSSPATVVISAMEGMGGVGKTQLAIHVAHRLVREGRFHFQSGRDGEARDAWNEALGISEDLTDRAGVEEARRRLDGDAAMSVGG